MSQTPGNPFDGAGGDPLGGGGFDLNALMQQAQQMQEQLEQAQQRLADTVVDGSVAGGAVTVRVNGVGELVGVDIRPGGVDGGDGWDTEALSDLGDLVVAAYRDAKSRADAMAAEALGPLAGGGPGGGADGAGPGGLPGLGF